jgi:multiple sugar transport system substrate-binding protein
LFDGKSVNPSIDSSSIHFLIKQISILLLLFFSCNPGQQSDVEITFWAMGTEGEYVQKLIPDFERRNPDIKVKVQRIPWTAAQEKLITAYASDNLPDVFQLGNTWVPQFAILNAIENLNEWIELSQKIKSENYFSGIWETNRINGSIYGIPWYIDTRVLFYRKDILEKAGFGPPPKSWDELYILSKKIKEVQNNPDKYAIYLPTNEWAPFVIFGLQAGSTLLKQNNSYGNFSGEAFKKAFEYLIRFHKEGLAPVGISRVTNVYQAFAEEYFAIYISGPWNVNEFKKWMKGGLRDKWMTAPLPGPNESTPGVSLAGGSSLVMSKKSRKKKEVWQFIEYLSESETQLKFYHLISDLPAVKSTWQDTSLKNNRYMKAFYEQFQYVVATPKIPEWEQIAFSKLQQYAEFAARDVMSVNETLRRLDDDVDNILEKRRWLMNKSKNNK